MLGREVTTNKSGVADECFARRCRHSQIADGHQVVLLRSAKYHAIVFWIPSRRPVGGSQPNSFFILSTFMILIGAPFGFVGSRTISPVYPTASFTIVARSRILIPLPTPTFTGSKMGST